MDLGRSLRALGYSLWGVTVIRYETKGACVLAMVVWAGSVGLVVPRAAEPQAAPARARAQAPAATPARAQAAPAAAPAASSPSIVAATVKDYCAACHNERTKTGGLVLTNLDPANIPADAEVWEKVIRKVRTGMMPPFGVRHPDPTDARHVRLAAVDHARSRGCCQAQSRTSGALSPESHRIRQRDPRPARSRGGCGLRCSRPTIQPTVSTTSPTCSASRPR